MILHSSYNLTENQNHLNTMRAASLYKYSELKYIQ